MEDIILDDLNREAVGQTETGASSDERNAKKSAIRRIKSFGAAFLFVLVWLGLGQFMAAEKYEASVKVVGSQEESIANPASESIDYGTIPQGSSSARFLTVKNNGNKDVYIKIISTGNIRKMLKARPDNFFLEAGKGKEIELLLQTGNDTKAREYQGKVIIFKLPKLW